MNIVRTGVILIAYTFVIILTYIVISDPAAEIINALAAGGSDISQMPSLITEIKSVMSICFAIAILTPTILFIWMAYTDTEIIY